MKIKEKEKAIILRRDGYSLVEIVRLLKVSKSTVSIWTKNTELGTDGQLRVKEKIINNQKKSHIHDYHNEKEMKDFWSFVTSLPQIQFNKSFIKKSNHVYKKDGYKGCLHIYYHDAYVARVLSSFAKKLTSLYI